MDDEDDDDMGKTIGSSSSSNNINNNNSSSNSNNNNDTDEADADPATDSAEGTTSTPMIGAETREDFRRRLTAYYEKVRPDKLNDIDTFMVRFDGRYDVYIRRLERKYGVAFPKGADDSDEDIEDDDCSSDVLFEARADFTRFVEQLIAAHPR